MLRAGSAITGSENSSSTSEDKIYYGWASHIQESIRLMRDANQLCDFTINVDSGQFRVHKILLAACSDYFKAMFTHDSSDKVTLQDVSFTTMKCILDFCYNSRINLDIDNVQEILIGATMMQISHIQSLCVDFIDERIMTSNCLGVLILADRCNLSELYERTLCFCLDKIDLIVEEKEWLDLDESWLAKLISHDQLNIDEEERVFEALLNWVLFDKTNRLASFDRLVGHIRFALFRPGNLVDLDRNDCAQLSEECRRCINEAKNYALLCDRPDTRSLMTGPRFEKRLSRRRQQRIYAVGGWTNEQKPISGVERYDPYLDEWSEVEPMTRPRCGVGVVIVGDHLYAIGGHDGCNYLKSAERYDIIGQAWHLDVADMRTERTSVGMVELDGYIYAIGGQCGPNCSTEVERYNTATNVWELCESLRERRLGAGVTVLDGIIYVMGGAYDIDIGGKGALKTVECYDPAEGRWFYIAPMTTSRKHFGCAVLNGKIYAVGGRGDSSELNAAECYDPVKYRWEAIPDMSEKRSGVALVELDGILYAIGGHNGDVRLDLVEAYDPIERTWTRKKNMIRERLGAGCAVYSKLYKSPINSSIMLARPKMKLPNANQINLPSLTQDSSSTRVGNSGD